MSDRLSKLHAMLSASPGDTFLLYAVAMELKKLGQPREAIEAFDKVIAHDWKYCYAYHQKGLILESLGETESARQAYVQGIDAARRCGDEHAAGEIAEALSQLGDAP